MRNSRRLFAASAALVGIVLLSGCVFTPFFSEIFYEGPTSTPDYTDPVDFGFTESPTPTP
ncbi:hypothetical protein [Gulosibacter sp. ACHW.36C]|uniref:Uncharacterized protein n=1 Tax=Gulosibacter sediminis TaxID=1729695 RepID=A0ABY4MZ61_9MICO|nr:hypothetical protein [Gulosibacter sediminis]UQN15357.1 hypothetical protein M3M28_02505 [Gulosibacter sediminis]